jgi:hypothetical protein
MTKGKVLLILIVIITSFAAGILTCLLFQREGLEWEYIHYSVRAQVSTESKPYTVGELVDLINDRRFKKVVPEDAAKLLDMATGNCNFKLQCATTPHEKKGEICINYVCRAGNSNPISFNKAYSKENKAKTAYVGDPRISKYGASSWLAYNEIFFLIGALNLGGVFARVDLTGHEENRAYDNLSWLCMALYTKQLTSINDSKDK